MTGRPAAVALLLLGLVASTGCRHYGPRSIVADRIPYNEAIALSWKEQTLLNVVKMRYADPPFFIDVPQITSGYTIQALGGVNGGIFPPVSPDASFAQQLGLTLNFQGGYQDRPTVSYQPQTGSTFIRNLTSPINPGSVLFLLQAGYPADVIFNLTVDTINGIRNQSVAGGQLRPADPEFATVVRTFRKAQQAGHAGIRVEPGKDKDRKDTVAFFFRDAQADPELARELAEVRRILRLDPVRGDFRVSFGATSTGPNEIAILSRSVFRILQELSVGVEVPEEHLIKGFASPTGPPPGDTPLLFHVHSGCKKPRDPFVAVCYDGWWFWIDKEDLVTKRTLGQLLVLLALSDTGAKENLPVITIQAN